MQLLYKNKRLTSGILNWLESSYEKLKLFIIRMISVSALSPSAMANEL